MSGGTPRGNLRTIRDQRYRSGTSGARYGWFTESGAPELVIALDPIVTTVDRAVSIKML
jgi:hypothetical protein